MKARYGPSRSLGGHCFTFALAAGLLLAAAIPAALVAAPKQPREPEFSAVDVIGDSLSDTGKLFREFGLPGPPAYFPGRQSNGPLWVEYLALVLGMEYDPRDNFAWNGATTGRANAWEERLGADLPGMLDQLDELLYGRMPRGRVTPRALYAVFGGAVDFQAILDGQGAPQTVIPAAVANLAGIVKTLHERGARHIMVFDLPDLGLTPRARMLGPQVAARATRLCRAFNILLEGALDRLGFDVIRVSTYQLLNDIVADPQDYGFSDVTTPGLKDQENGETHLFWDDVHPTTLAHAWLAEAVVQAIDDAADRFRPRADLRLAKTASQARIKPGDTYSYTLGVTNNGPNRAENVVVTDNLPAGVRLVGTSVPAMGDRIVRVRLGSLAANAEASILLTVQAGAGVAGNLRNTARVADRATFDPTPKNNHASASVRVLRPPPPPGGALSLLPTDTLLPSAFFGQPYSVIFSGDGGQAPLGLVGGGAPPGLSFAAGATNQLELGGTPAQPGNFIVTITLTDNASPPATVVRNYQLTVVAELDIVPRALPITQVGDNFITTFMTANGIPPDSFTSSDPLPPGLVLNGNSLSGRPTEVGNFSFMIGATDGAGNQGTRDYTLNVLPAGLLILTDTLPDAVVNASYGAQVLALGGTKPYSWRADSAVPDGLTFNNFGFFSGRPTVTGAFIVTVTVQDQAGAEASADLALTVNATGLVNLTPDIFPNGLLGAPYNVPILADGGTPPYQCVLVDGQLPPGLSLTGCATFAQPPANGGGSSCLEFAIEGTPTIPGAFPFTIGIADSSKPRNILRIPREIVVFARPPGQ